MTHQAWEGPAHRDFLEDLRTNGYRPLLLHYNTGRAIPDNGRNFQNLLTRLSQSLSPDASIILIGHSMGGLLVRSACHFDTRDGSSVRERISRVAYLGSPHFGAPLERLGYHGNSLLGLLAFTRTFMSLRKL
jgi:triacylglycerol esterase/lipase EstA (alpha/beta hydrolase family)